MENTPNTFSLMKEGGMKRGPGLGDMSGITHSLEEDSITASSAGQREEKLGMIWSYILGMLTNVESPAGEDLSDATNIRHVRRRFQGRSSEAEERLEKFGPNCLTPPHKFP